MTSVASFGNIESFYLSLLINSFKLSNCIIDSGASNNVIPAKVTHALGLTLTKYYGWFYSMETKKVPLIGQIKDARFAFVAFSEKRVKKTILVFDILVTYGILLGRGFCKDVGGEINMDWTKAKIPVNGVPCVLHPEAKSKYLVTKLDDPKAQIIFEDAGLGNYFLTSEVPSIEVKEEDPNTVWTLDFDGIYSTTGSGPCMVLISQNFEIFPFTFKLQFDNTNNTAEYETLLLGLEMER